MIVLQDPLTQPTSGYGARLMQQQAFGHVSAAQTGTFQRPCQGSINAGINNIGTTTKRYKVYCDKWVHEGICAFTQQGCKFKHEMPHDRSIQRSLGLFHGYPNWYKKQQAQEQASAAMDAAAPILQSLPASSSQQQQNQYQTSTTSLRTPTTATYVPRLASVHPNLYQPPSGGSGGSSSSSSLNDPWRSNGVNAQSWRGAQTVAGMADNSLGDGSINHNLRFADSFARSLSFGEQPLGRVYQGQIQLELHQQRPEVPPLPEADGLVGAGAYPVSFDFDLGLGSRGRVGSLGALDGEPTDRLLNSTSGGRGSFGPIGPPTRVLSQEMTVPTSFAHLGSQGFVHSEQPCGNGGDSLAPEW
ncbi:MAG: hypothetical protein STHCBS139747_000251 [Sporothrix thermara]